MKTFVILFILFLTSIVFSAPGDLIWKTKADDSFIEKTILCNDLVITLNKDGYIYAYNSHNGIQKWNKYLEYPESIDSGNGLIYCGFASNSYSFFFVQAFKPETGEGIWGSGNLRTFPDICYSNNVVYITGYRGSPKLRAVNSSNGQMLWTIDRSNCYTPGSFNSWLCIGENSGLSCYNNSDGQLKWGYTSTIVNSHPVFSEGYVFFGCTDNYLYALNAETGSLRWRYLTNRPIYTSPCLWETMELIYIGSRDSSLYSIDINNCSLVWKYKTGGEINSSPYFKDGYIYSGSNDTYIYCLNASNGNLAWKYKTNDSILSSPCVGNGIIYIGSNDTYLYAIETYGYTGINNNKSSSYLPAKSFSASPNPFSSRLLVSLSSSGAIYSLTGQLIVKLNKGKHSLDTISWREGVYIVKSGKETKRIVKIKN